MGRRPLVSLILVTWNSASYLRRCLEGIAGQHDVDLQIIVVDNASKDDTVSIARAALPEASFVLNEENRGFAAAVNQGLAVSRGEFIALLNPDAFLGAGYLACITAAFAATPREFGMATGRLMQGAGTSIAPTGVVDSKGIRMTRTGRHFDIGQGEPDRPDERSMRPIDGHPTLHEVFGVSGAAAVYRREFLDAVAIDGEVFDEDFHSYREDADLSWRGRLMGWRALYVPEAEAFHVRLVTPQARRNLSPVVNMHSLKNRFLLRLKNEGIYLALRNAPFAWTRDLTTIVAALTIERTSLPAFAWLWRNRRRILRKRRLVQTKRRVPDRDLAGWFA